jgi:xanthine dehydrogenase molybdenum-binding subunit
MATVAWRSGIVGAGLDHSAAVASLEADGSVALAAASPDLGTGIHTTLVQVCAEALGVEVDRVRLGPTDTAVTPFDVGAFASRSLYRMGAAVERAARELRRLVLAEAAELLEIDPADLDLAGGAVVVRGSPERTVPLSAVARRVIHDGRELRARGQAPPTMAPAFAVQFVELEVDAETGEVAVTRVVTAQEVGRAINPAIVVGQVDGAVVQGLGYALFEDLAADPATGTIVTSTLADYPIATAVDVPPMEVIIVEDPDATGPFGARGVGEPAITLTAPAVANALLDAIGVAPTSLPLSPMRIRAAIRGEARP